MAKMTCSNPWRRNWLTSMSRNGRSPMVASDFGASPVTLLRRVPAPPQRTIASATLGIDLASITSQGFVIRHFGLVHRDVTAPTGKCERNAEKIFQTRSHCLFALGRHVKKHKTTAAGTKEFSSQRAGTEPCLVDFINIGVRNLFRQRSL